jgi:maltooligosyltrehalose trehalohydrolase
VRADIAAVGATRAATEGRPLFVIAESDLNDPVFVRPPPEGYGLDASWADDWHHALHAALTGERDGYYEDFGTLDHLVKALEQAWVYDGAWSPHRQRPHGHSPAGLRADRFVVSAQNHDQIGNRATGERLPALTSWGRVHIAAALLLTTPFVPMLFQGEEWGASTPFLYFTDHQDRALGEAVSEGRRQEFAAFGWAPEQVPDPQDPATFAWSQLDWAEAGRSPHDALLAWYRSLIALRRAEPSLHDPEIPVTASHADGLLVVDRGSLRVVANLDAHEQRTPLAAGLVMGSEPGVHVDQHVVVLPVDSVAILRTRSTDETDG